MNQESKAIETFLGSPHGSNLLEPSTIGLPLDKLPYLRNRLREAFIAGMAAGKGIAVDRIADKMRGLAD